MRDTKLNSWEEFGEQPRRRQDGTDDGSKKQFSLRIGGVIMPDWIRITEIAIGIVIGYYGIQVLEIIILFIRCWIKGEYVGD